MSWQIWDGCPWTETWSQLILSIDILPSQQTKRISARTPQAVGVYFFACHKPKELVLHCSSFQVLVTWSDYFGKQTFLLARLDSHKSSLRPNTRIQILYLHVVLKRQFQLQSLSAFFKFPLMRASTVSKKSEATCSFLYLTNIALNPETLTVITELFVR